MKFGISDKSCKLLMELFNSIEEVEKVIIFGSRVLGNYKPGSDIDLAFFGENLNSKLLSKLNFTINEELPIPYKVDVLSFNEIKNEELKKHILTEGKVFFER